VATQLSGQTGHLRAAVTRRLHEGDKPSFPPAARDAPLLGGTVIDMLEEEAGARAVASLAAGRLSSGAETAIERAFDRPLFEVERDWRARLSRAGAGPRVGRRRGHLFEVDSGGDDAA
jgi:hypothetical protein